MKLNELKKLKGTRSSKKRIGRGTASGKGGHTVGRGHKGQKARAGSSIPVGFEGGQTPLYKRLPMIGGFKSTSRFKVIGVPLNRLNVFEKGTVVTPKSLVDKRVIRNLGKNRVKILGNGKIDRKLVLKGFLYSEKAKEKLEKAGAKIS
jgi:large subunit ribosomal protein L15